MIRFFPLKNTQQGNGLIFSTGVFLSFAPEYVKLKLFLNLKRKKESK